MSVAISSCPNFRCLSGYRKISGGITKGFIYRSDSLSKITNEEADILHNNNICCIIDLRYKNELEESPNPLNGKPGFVYNNVSLTDGFAEGKYDSYLDESMWAFYIGLAEESAAELARVFKIMAANKDMGIVVHCTAGKDRTGVVCALLLMVAGVAREDIISDYTRTYALLSDAIERDKAALRAKGAVYKDHVFLSEPKYIERFIEHIETKYGGAKQYLENAGLSPDEIRIIETLV